MRYTCLLIGSSSYLQDRALFLELPDPEDSWEDPTDDLYSSGRIFVRQAYVDLQSIIFSRVYALPEKIQRYRMMLAGTPGTGKSFFTRYFVWSVKKSSIFWESRAVDPRSGIVWGLLASTGN